MPLPLGPILLGAIIAAAARILIGLGIGFVSFTVALPELYTFLNGYFGQLPPDILAIAGLLKLDICMTLILSAGAAKVAYNVAAAPLISIGS